MAKFIGWVVVVTALAVVIGISARKLYSWWHR